MRKLLYGLAGIVAVAVAALFILPALIDMRALVQPALQAVKEATGRDVRIGSIGLSLLPPAAAVGDLTVSNIPGAANPDMVRIKTVEVRVALLPLLSGRIEVSSVAIGEPVVAIETLKDGRSSLDFPKNQTAGKQAEVRLDQIAVKNGLMILRDAAGGERRIEAVNASGSAESLSGPFRAKGSARVAGVPVNLDLATGRMEPGKPGALNAALDGAGGRAQFQGTVTTPAAPGPNAETAVAGKLALTTANLAAFVDQVNAGGAALPPLAAQAFSLEGSVKGTPSQIAVPDIAVTLGDMRGTGALALGMGPRTTVQLALNLGRIDLDKLLTQAGAKPAPAAPVAAAKAPAAAAAGPSIPPNFVAAVDIGVEAIAYRGQSMQQARLQLDVLNGVATVKRLDARLPAGSNVLVANLPLPLGGQAPAISDGRVEAHSDNLRGLLEWLGADLSAIPPGRVGRFDLKAAVRSDGRTVQIVNLDSTLDASRLTGGVSMAWQGRPGFGMRANLDRINLDAYLPAAGAKPRAAAAPAGVPGGDALRLLEAFDLDLAAEIATLTYRETPIQGVKLALELVNGRLNVKDLSARDLAGAQAEMKLVADKLSTNPAFSTAFGLRAPDARRLIKFMSGVDAPPAAGAAGALGLSGTATGTRDELKLDAAMQGLGGQAKVAGSLAQLTQQAPKIDLTVDAAFPEFGPVLTAFAGVAAKHGQQKLGPMSLKSRLANTGPDSIALRQTELRAFGGAMTMEGTVGRLLSAEPSVDLSAAMNLPSLRPLLTAFNPDPQLMATADQLGALSFAGKAVGSAKKMALRDAALNGLGGAVKLSGDVLDAGQRFDLNVDIQNFSVGPLMAALPGPVITAAGAKQLGPVTGKVAIKGALDNLSVTMQNVALRGFGGSMALNGGITDAADPTRKLDLSFDIDRVELGQLLAAFPAAGASPALASGLRTATIKGAVKGAGSSPSLTLNPATVQAFGGTVSVNGTVTDASSPAAKYDLTASANVPSLYQMLLAFYRPAYQMAGPLAFDNVRLVGDGKRVKIDNLVGTLGPVGVAAQGFFTLDGPRPKIDMDIKTSGDLFVDAFMPADLRKRTDIEPYWRKLFADLMPAAVSSQIAQAQVHPRWSRDPISLEVLDKVDMDLRLLIASLRSGEHVLTNLSSAWSLKNGSLKVSNIDGTLAGGKITGQVDLSQQPGVPPRIGISLRAVGLDNAQLVKEPGGVDLILGRTNVDMRLLTTIRSQADVIANMQGDITLSGIVKTTSGPTSQIKQQLGPIAGVLGQFDVKRMDQFMAWIKQVEGIMKTVALKFAVVDPTGMLGNTLEFAMIMGEHFEQVPGQLTGNIAIRSGVAATQNLQIANNHARILAKGARSYPAYIDDMLFEGYITQPATAAAPAQQQLAIVLSMQGPIDKPNVKMSRPSAQPAAQGVPSGQPQVQPKPGQQILDTLLGKPQQTPPAPAGTPAPAPAKPNPLDQYKGLLDQLTKPKQ
jgi:uncharacterized protein involved in outer membrane biogenesis